MKINDKIFGFAVKREERIEELCATLYELEHERTGAKLCYLDRKDENMSFAISFATPPEDDTGVFHIIEHSVLCGSEKYPLRDPFAELLKGSLNTFLNAMTYEDRTVYPVSSRCERDFLNLVDVYLDAVLRPNFKKNSAIFRQEGWHYEYDGETLSRSGVVYNEMKGAYSSPEDLAAAELNRALYGEGTYAKDSGGDPAAIPTLTYSMLLAAHDRYYHPSNAQIFLDGSLDIEKLLSLIDSHIRTYDRREICAECIIESPRKVTRAVSYEIPEGEDPTDRARLVIGYCFSDYSRTEELVATTVLCDYLCSTNASVLKHALLEAGLCRDVAMYTNRSKLQTVFIEVRDAKAENFEKIESFIDEKIREIAEKGLDRENLAASLNYTEFKLRESDFGAMPSGVIFALSVFGIWRYGGAPETALRYEEELRSVREKINTDYFDRLLLDMTVNNPHRAAIYMLPDPTLSEKRAEAEAAELAEILKNLSREELDRIVADREALTLWQESEEDEEAKATIPKLSISDIPKDEPRLPVTEKSEDGATALFVKSPTGGISYVNLYFDASDLQAEELWQLALMSSLLGNLDTAKWDALTLQNKAKASLGALTVSTAVAARDGKTTPYLKLTASALDTNLDSLTEIVTELLLSSDYNNAKEIENTLSQAKSAFEDATLSSGHSVALNRVEASYTSRAAINEYLSGYEAYLKYKELCDTRELREALPSTLKCLAHRLLVKERLTVTVVGGTDDGLSSRLAAAFPGGEAAEHIEIQPFGVRRDFILAPTKVAYATAGAVVEGAEELMGTLKVARSILSYEYLWSTVRMAGGAYGAGFVPRRGGLVAFYSYRDPSPARTLGCFADSAEYLRSLGEADLTKFIIGAVGEADVLTTPRSAGAIAIAEYMNGITPGERSKNREAMLNSSGKDMVKIANLIDEAAKGAVCIVGNREHLASCENHIENVLKL